MKKITTRNLVRIALLSGLSYIFFMWEFKIVDPLQFDFSDVFVIIAGYTMGIGPGLLVALIKNILHLLLKNSQLIGELTNFVYASLVMIPLVMVKPKTTLKRIAWYVGVILFVTLSINVFNYFISMPIYKIAQEIRMDMILYTFIPFNIIKTTLIILVFNLIYPVFNRMLS